MVRRELLHEFIGKELCVLRSKAEGLRGKKGVIIDETKNTFVILTEEEKKGKEKNEGKKHEGQRIIRIPKEPCVFEIKFGNRWIRVNGKEILYRPEDRTKMLK